MIDWFVLLTPLLILPIVLVFVFVGCTLQTTPLFGAAPQVTFFVTFDPEVAEEEDFMPHVLVDIVGHTMDGQDVTESPSRIGDQDRTELDDGRFQYTIEAIYQDGEYCVTCRVYANARDSAIVETAAPCHLSVVGSRTVQFEAQGNVFNAIGCDE